AKLRGNTPGISVTQFLIAAIIISWAAAILLTYAPLFSMTQGLEYQLPDIFDLPKHLFALQALADAHSWPAQNPFFYGEDFSYNYLYYLPAALIGNLAGSPAHAPAVFASIVVLTAVALPLTLLDIVRQFTASKIAHVITALLAT